MNTRTTVANRILELCKEKNLTIINGLACLSAVPPTTLKNILSGVSKNPDIVTIKLLYDGLEITIRKKSGKVEYFRRSYKQRIFSV